LQIAGNVRFGGLYECAFGLTLGAIVNDIAGGTATGRPVKAVQVGGPLGAWFPPSLFDTPFGYEEFGAKDGLIGHAGLTIADDSTDMLSMARFAMEFCAIESCGKCTPCRIGAVRGVETLDRVARRRHRRDPAADRPVRHDEIRLALRAGGLHALSGAERPDPFPR
jgi:formate dehydrogenase iron-sulfur subunit